MLPSPIPLVGILLVGSPLPPLAQTAPAGPAGLLGSPFLLIAVLFLVMYFTMIRPQARQAKAHRAMVDALQKGDKVVTAGGVHGTVTKVEETSLLLQVDDATRLRIDKQKVAYSLTPKDKAADAKA